MKVYVVTGLELGWDCVVGVFADVSVEKLQEAFPEGSYVITEREVEYNLYNWIEE